MSATTRYEHTRNSSGVGAEWYVGGAGGWGVGVGGGGGGEIEAADSNWGTNWESVCCCKRSPGSQT